MNGSDDDNDSFASDAAIGGAGSVTIDAETSTSVGGRGGGDSVNSDAATADDTNSRRSRRRRRMIKSPMPELRITRSRAREASREAIAPTDLTTTAPQQSVSSSSHWRDVGRSIGHSTVLGASLGAGGAYLSDQSVTNGAFEGTVAGAVGGAISHVAVAGNSRASANRHNTVDLTESSIITHIFTSTTILRHILLSQSIKFIGTRRRTRKQSSGRK